MGDIIHKIYAANRKAYYLYNTNIKSEKSISRCGFIPWNFKQTEIIYTSLFRFVLILPNFPQADSQITYYSNIEPCFWAIEKN